MDQRCRIELLGGLRASIGDQEHTRFTTRQCGSLLAYLAYHLQSMHPREVLATLLWPDATEKAGRTSLNHALTSLRHQLEPPGIVKGSIIQGDRHAVGLNSNAVTTDVREFESLLEAVPRAGNPSVRAQRLSDAIDLYRGELLPGLYEDWVVTEQQRLAAVYFNALDRLIAQLEQTGDYQLALKYARRAVSMDPLREESHLHIMRLNVALNQHAAARQQYRELADLFRERLGATPSTAIIEFIRDLERQPITKVTSPPVHGSRQISSDPLPPMTSTITFLAADTGETIGLQGHRGSGLSERCATVLRAAFAEHDGHPVWETGGSFLVAFAACSKALDYAVACQSAVMAMAVEEERDVALRMALHTGDVSRGEGGYDGPAVKVVTRLVAAVHGGQILCSQTTAELLRGALPPDVLLADVGLYRLRGGPLPERLYQVTHPELRRDFPPLPLDAGYQSQLPVPLTRFFGREAEIAELQEALRDRDTRLVTLTGSGGAGKTRLSLEVARSLLDVFSGAVWFVSLADLADARLIVGAISDAIGLLRSPVLEPLQQVIEALGRQPSLLLLDNFEQVLDEGAGIVQNLLERVPTLTCFVTSRQVLALTGEREYALAPLPTPQGVHTPETLTMYESVRLFVDRAQATRPDFQVTNHNAPAIAEICSRLEGIPLAIELAAARVQQLTPDQMVAQMEHRFDLLVSRKRNIEARHRTLRAAIDWSYRLLPPEVQGFFIRLAAFRGGWTVEAAATVCELGTEEEGLGAGPGQTPDFLEHLRECSLVQSEESATGMRYRLLETIREFAWEKMPEEDRKALLRRHTECFIQFVRQAEPGIRGPESALWLVRVDAEHDNLRAMLEWSHDHDPDLGLRLAGALALFWDTRGHWREGYIWFTTLLQNEASVDVLSRATALLAAGNLAQVQGNYDDAQQLYRAARRLFEERHRSHGHLISKHGIAVTLNGLGLLEQAHGNYRDARLYFEQSLAMKQEYGDSISIANARANLGYLAYQAADLPTARGYLHAAISALRTGGEKRLLANSLNNLGGVTCREGDYTGARTLLEESLNLRCEIDDRKSLAYSLDEFAHLAAALKDPVRAAHLSGAAEALRSGIGCSLTPTEHEQRMRFVALLRQDLGEAAFAVEWERGQALTVAQAVAIAREEQAP